MPAWCRVEWAFPDLRRPHAMIPADIRQDILHRLQRAEQEHQVRILFAIESGSRAWGFASPNSDYDVRFVYAHPRDWYLAVDLEERRDVIEYPIVDDIDLNGWDVRKALRLLWKSNPALIEWLQSPITYCEHGDFRQQALALLPAIYTSERGLYHYRSMASKNYRGYLKQDEVPLKKYFYVLRPLLAARWIADGRGAPPMEFERLLAMLNADEAQVRADIHTLLAQKRQAPELGRAAAVPSLNAFIETELARTLPELPWPPGGATRLDPLNQLFHATLAEGG